MKEHNSAAAIEFLREAVRLQPNNGQAGWTNAAVTTNIPFTSVVSFELSYL